MCENIWSTVTGHTIGGWGDFSYNVQTILPLRFIQFLHKAIVATRFVFRTISMDMNEWMNGRNRERERVKHLSNCIEFESQRKHGFCKRFFWTFNGRWIVTIHLVALLMWLIETTMWANRALCHHKIVVLSIFYVSLPSSTYSGPSSPAAATARENNNNTEKIQITNIIMTRNSKARFCV